MRESKKRKHSRSEKWMTEDSVRGEQKKRRKRKFHQSKRKGTLRGEKAK